MGIHPFGDAWPRVDPTAYVAPGARIVGDVTIGPRASVWFNAVVRGDSAPVEIGAGTNVQDGAVLHVDRGFPCTIGEDCTIGHLALVHGCRVGRGSLVGMAAVVLSGAVIGEESIVGAGALVPGGHGFPPRSLLVGVPARVVRAVTDEDLERTVLPGLANYQEYARAYRAGGVVDGDPGS